VISEAKQGNDVKNRRRWLAALACVLVLAATVGTILEPNRIVRGWLAGEPFFRWRPASYWKEVLRAAPGDKPPYRKSRAGLYPKEDALNVLLLCARDADPNVRRPALYLLAEGHVRLYVIRDALTDALADPDLQARLTAVNGLAGYGPRASSCVPAIIPLLHDSEEQIAFAANLALWDIDPAAARDATGWRQFTSDEWGFSAMLPSEPEESNLSIPGPVPSVSHQFLAVEGGVSRFGVAVADFPAEGFFPPTDAQRLDLGRDSVLAGLKAKGLRLKLSGEAPIEAGGRNGREFLVEAEGMGFLRSRLFWEGRRLYQVKVASKPEFLNAKAADYFMDSFRINGTEAKAR
jgi:hypothetical protein